jgi:hypothetical protein
MAYTDADFRGAVRIAMDTAVHDCMAAKGFVYPVGAVVHQPTAPAIEEIDRAIGATNPNDIATHGYVVDFGVADTGKPTDDSPAFHAALFGPSDVTDTIPITDPDTGVITGSVEIRQGCVGHADGVVYGDAQAKAQFVGIDLQLQHLAIDAITASLSSKSIVALFGAWSACMKTKGYDYNDPLQPLSVEWPEPRPSQHEVETAIADVDCKASIGLVIAFRTEVQQRVNESEAQSAAAISEWTTLRNRILQRVG